MAANEYYMSGASHATPPPSYASFDGGSSRPQSYPAPNSYPAPPQQQAPYQQDKPYPPQAYPPQQQYYQNPPTQSPYQYTPVQQAPPPQQPQQPYRDQGYPPQQQYQQQQQPYPNQVQQLQRPPFNTAYTHPPPNAIPQSAYLTTPPSSSSSRPHKHSHHNSESHHSNHSHHSHSPSPSREKTKQHDKNNTTLGTFVGAGGGALIGDLIFPGLGTIGGALLGGVGGHEVAKKSSRDRRNRKSATRDGGWGTEDEYEAEYREGERRRSRIAEEDREGRRRVRSER